MRHEVIGSTPGWLQGERRFWNSLCEPSCRWRLLCARPCRPRALGSFSASISSAWGQCPGIPCLQKASWAMLGWQSLKRKPGYYSCQVLRNLYKVLQPQMQRGFYWFSILLRCRRPHPSQRLSAMVPATFPGRQESRAHGVRVGLPEERRAQAPKCPHCPHCAPRKAAVLGACSGAEVLRQESWSYSCLPCQRNPGHMEKPAWEAPG